MTFSIIVVCLNAGDKLRETIESIRNQTEQDYEVIIKDGGSTDEITRTQLSGYSKEPDRDSPHNAPPDNRIRVYSAKDAGIYDAMNQAVRYVRGDYVFFLNCGDSFYDDRVLARVKKQILQVGSRSGQWGAQTSTALPSQHIFYGNIYERQTNALVQSNPVIDDFACYRNVPCHQACFYSAKLLKDKAFDAAYKVRADYEHFLWCIYAAHAVAVYMPVTVAFYEGGGFSEARENRKISQREHREIVNKYLPAAKVHKYRLIMFMTLAPLRTWIAHNPVTAKIYQRIKQKLYKG